MKRTRADLHERLLAEARVAAAGETPAPVAVIEAGDRDLLRALRKASREERAGLLRLLSRVGARGKRIAEQALELEDLKDEARLGLLELMLERQKDHPIPVAYEALSRALAGNDAGAAASALLTLPGPLRGTWMRHVGVRLLATAPEAIGRLLGALPASAESLLSSLGKDLSSEALAALAAIAGPGAPRAVQKAVRGAFFRLQQQGLAVPALAVPETLATRAEALESRAFISGADEAGQQAVWVLEELPEGGYSALQAVLSDDGSLEEARALVLVRRGYETLIRKLEEKTEALLAAAPVPLAMGLLEEAYALNPAAAGRDYRAWRQMSAADRRARPPQPQPLPDAEESSALVARSSELAETACGSWLLLRGEAERAEKLLDEETSSPLVLPGHEQSRRRGEGLRRTVDAVFPPPRTARYARRLDGTALVFELRGETRLAALARAAARAARERPPSDVPFLVSLVERTLDALAEVRRLEEQKKSATGTPGPGTSVPRAPEAGPGSEGYPAGGDTVGRRGTGRQAR